MADFGINALAYGSARVSQADTWIFFDPKNTWTRVDGAGFTVSNSGRSLVIILNKIPTARPFIQTSNVDNMEVTGIYYNNGQFTIGVQVDDEDVWTNLVNSGSAAALHFLIYEPAVPTNALTTLIDDLTTRVTELENSNQSVPGTGDLCSLLSADSGYQMFRNGLTMQWMSDNFTQEGSRVINFPIAFAAKPFKVVASIRHEGKMPEDTQQWMHVVNWTKDHVTVYCQSHKATEFKIGVDIIAIGIAEVVNCPNSEGSSGTKISNLKKAESLEDSDLFVVSKEVDGDTVYDTSNNVTMSSLTESIKTRMGPTLSTSSIISWTKAEGSSYINGVAGFTGDTLPDGTWVLLYFPWYSYDGGGEDDNAWYHQRPIIREEVKGFNIRTWMQSLGNASHFGGSNYTGHGIGFKISEDPV